MGGGDEGGLEGDEESETAAARLRVRLRALGLRFVGVDSGLRRMNMESIKPQAWAGPINMPHFRL